MALPTTRSSRYALLTTLALLLAMLLAACGGSTTERLTDARPTPAPEAPPTTAEAAAPTVAAATATPEPPTATPEPPTATPVPLADPVVQASGFAQAKQRVGFGVVIENPNPAAALEDVSLQVVAYGAGDLVLGTDESRIPLLPPDATIHFGGDMFLDAEQPVERVEVQITDLGEPQEATPEQLPPFAVDQPRFAEMMFGQKVSGVVRNPFTLPLTDLYIGIVGFNAAGEVVGGGFTFLSFVEAEGMGAFDTSVTMRETPARVEVSPLVSLLTLFGQRDELPALTLEEQGWSLDGAQAGYGVIVSNPDAAQAMEGAQYRATAFAEDGSVLGVDTGYFGTILPGAKGARGGTLFLGTDGPAPSKVEVQVFPGRLGDATGKLAFTAEAASYVPGQFGSKATGQILNPYAEQVENLEVVAILRDGAGAIVGGGFTFVDTLPSGGKVAVEMTVQGAGAAGVELYPMEVSLTSIGAD